MINLRLPSEWLDTYVQAMYSHETGNVVRRLVVLPGFWTIQTSAHATLNEAISRALEAIDPYFRQGCVVRLDDEWGGDLGVKERKAIPLALLKGNDYWFCMGTDVDDALVAVHVCDSKGKCLENTAWQTDVLPLRGFLSWRQVRITLLLRLRVPRSRGLIGQCCMV